MIPKSAILSVPCLLGVIAYAGNEHGNGGDVLVCPHADPQIRLYDHYEGERRGFVPELGSGTTYEEKVEYVLARLSRINPSRAKLYRKRFEEFRSNEHAEFTTEELVDVPDTGAGTLPAGCTLKQAAIQKASLLPGDKTYTIDKKLWDFMDSTTRAGLALHEVIFNEAIRLGHEDSTLVRYFNAAISSTALDSMTVQDFYKLILLVNLRTFDAQGGIRMKAKADQESPYPAEPYFNENGLVAEGWPDAVRTFPEGFEDRPQVTLFGRSVNLLGYMRFYETGKIFTYQVDSDSQFTGPFPIQGCSRFRGRYVGIGSTYGIMELRPDGSPQSIGGLESIEVEYPDGRQLRYFERIANSAHLITRVAILEDGCPVLEGLHSEPLPQIRPSTIR